jgi:hypothetical protein
MRDWRMRAHRHVSLSSLHSGSSLKLIIPRGKQESSIWKRLVGPRIHCHPLGVTRTSSLISLSPDGGGGGQIGYLDGTSQPLRRVSPFLVSSSWPRVNLWSFLYGSQVRTSQTMPSSEAAAAAVAHANGRKALYTGPRRTLSHDQLGDLTG